MESPTSRRTPLNQTSRILDEMQDDTRRTFLTSGLVMAGAALLGPSSRTLRHATAPHGPPPAHTMPVKAVATAAPASLPGPVRPELLGAALAALNRHGRRIDRRDRIAIADFGVASSDRRLHLVDLEGGRTLSLLVAHGSGSDPDHSGWLRRFSNQEGSNASSEGAFVTRDYYVGKHGRSQRLIGLDPTNSNARERAIVVHGAWYADAAMLASHGKLGRSQGCFAVGDGDLDTLFRHLGPGRMIFAAKV